MNTNCELEVADRDGVFPERFYCTTNLPTEVYLDGDWVPVEDPEMDCGIVIDRGGPRSMPVSDVRAGAQVVVGTRGVRVTAPPRVVQAASFEFMASAVSSEKPKAVQIAEVARAMRRVRAAGQRILWVVGPAVVHTGAAPDLAALVEAGWVNALFAGNGVATHDIESQIYKTSLGVSVENGEVAHRGHEHHIRTINAIRRAGGIAAAVEAGVVKAGVMHALVTHKVPFVLGGSVRDDGPLPDTVTDVIEAQRRMRAEVHGVGLCLVIASMLHGIATGNLLPGTVPIVCVDIHGATMTKLLDRGSLQGKAIVTDVGLFLRELRAALAALETSK